MKTMLATIGICVAMAAAGCAQKADSSATLAAFDDNKSSSCCMSKMPGNGCPMTTKAAAASTGCCTLLPTGKGGGSARTRTALIGSHFCRYVGYLQLGHAYTGDVRAGVGLNLPLNAQPIVARKAAARGTIIA